MPYIRVILIEGFGKQRGVFYGDKFFPLKEVVISPRIILPDNLDMEEIPEYGRQDMPHYFSALNLYIERYKESFFLKHEREPTCDEINRAIEGNLRGEFQYLYYKQYKNDSTKIKPEEQSKDDLEAKTH